MPDLKIFSFPAGKILTCPYNIPDLDGKTGQLLIYGYASTRLVGMVDVIFADVAQPDQARIVGLNAHLFLKVGGGVLVSIKANCIDSTAKPEVVFAKEVQKLREERIKPKEQLTLGKSSQS